jgi:hypothetical protein
MMKHLYIKRAFGGLGLAGHITIGHIGADGILGVVMVDMDTMAVEVVEDIIGAQVVDLGAAVEEEEIAVEEV